MGMISARTCRHRTVTRGCGIARKVRRMMSGRRILRVINIDDDDDDFQRNQRRPLLLDVSASMGHRKSGNSRVAFAFPFASMPIVMQPQTRIGPALACFYFFPSSAAASGYSQVSIINSAILMSFVSKQTVHTCIVAICPSRIRPPCLFASSQTRFL